MSILCTNNSIPEFDPDHAWEWQSPQPNAGAGTWCRPNGIQKPDYTAARIDVEEQQVSYKYDTLRNRWQLERISSKGKIRIIPLTAGFQLISCTIYSDDLANLRFARIVYRADGIEYDPIVPAADYFSGRFDKHLKRIARLPSCKRRQFNDLISWLLQTIPHAHFTICRRAGWFKSSTGDLFFACCDPHIDVPEHLLPSSLRRRRNRLQRLPAAEIVKRWDTLFRASPVLHIIGNYNLGSQLLLWLAAKDVHIRSLLAIIPSEGFSEEQLIAALATNDLTRFPAVSLSSAAVARELSETWDGVVVFTGPAFADEAGLSKAGLKLCIHAVREDDGEEHSRNLIAVVSRNAGIQAQQLAPENVFVLDTDGVHCEASAAELTEIAGDMEQVFRDTLQRFVSQGGEKYLLGIIGNLHKGLADALPPNAAAMLTLILTVERLLCDLFQCNEPVEEDWDAAKKLIANADRPSPAEWIVRDFYAALSKALRDGKLHPVRKRKNVPLPLDEKTVLINGSRLLLSREILTHLLDEMTSIRKLSSLIGALRDCGLLISTDGDTHPTEVHNAAGQPVRLHWYDVAIDQLDTDCIDILNNLESQAFWLQQNEVPRIGFLPLLRDNAGNIAGALLASLDNRSTLVCGQSGWGKSYCLSQLAALCAALGHTVIWVDSGDSATPDALAHNLSDAFVRQHICFCDIDRDGFPIDLWALETSLTPQQKRRQIFGVLKTGLTDLGPMEEDALDLAIFRTLEKKTNADIQTDDIIAALNGHEHGMTKLRARLRPLLEDIDNFGMSQSGWAEFLQESGNFIVLRINPAFAEHAQKLLDMLIASLFAHQRAHAELELDLFLDEAQKFNVNASSPIRQITSEGRKFRMAVFAATHDFPPRNTDLARTFGRTATQIFLRPTVSSERIIADTLRLNKAETEAFDSMRPGDAIVRGTLYNNELGRNVSAIVRGRICDFFSDDEKSSPEVTETPEGRERHDAEET